MAPAFRLLVALASILPLAGAAQPASAPRGDVGCAARGGPLVSLTPSGSRLRAVIAPAHGGELVSLSLREGNGWRELLYRGLDFCDRPGWEGKAPVLWPATGRNFAIDPATLPAGAKADAAFGWTWQGRRLPMPIHGFARATAWHLEGVKHGGRVAEATVSLTDNAATRADYPFGFRLTITYVVSGNTLTVRHHVMASGGNPEAMPFSIGNHITFDTTALSAAGGETRLSTPASLRIPTDAFGRPAETVETSAPLVNVPIAALGRNSALSLGGYAQGAVYTRLDGTKGLSLMLSQSDVPQARADAVRFNLWGDPGSGYFAVEPWYGRQNALADGQGIVRLKPGRAFDWTFTVTVSGDARN